jgi:hypothetical protein
MALLYGSSRLTILRPITAEYFDQQAELIMSEFRAKPIMSFIK